MARATLLSSLSAVCTSRTIRARYTRKAMFINTTNFDNMPVSVIEAMALGLPVISTNVGGIPYLIDNEKDGFLVNKNDAMAFVEAIKKVVNNVEFTQKITSNARNKAEDFNWSNVKNLWVSMLQ